MNTQHTKGENNKWKVKPYSKNCLTIQCNGFREDQKGGYVAEIVWASNVGGISREDEANAKLIAAAPDMIEFIGKVMSKLQEHQKEDKKILAGYTLAANIEGFTDLLNEAGEIWRAALSWND